jgi:hypothetical protein
MIMKTRLLTILVLAAFLSAACGSNGNANNGNANSGSGSGLTSQQKAAASNALTALRKIQAATQVGVNYQQYGPLLIEAKSQVNTAASTLPQSGLKSELQAAVEAYTDAYDGWEKTMSGGIIIAGSPDIERMKAGVAVGQLMQKYGIPATDVGRDPMTGGTMKYVTKDALLSTIFKAGSAHVERASRLQGE